MTTHLAPAAHAFEREVLAQFAAHQFDRKFRLLRRPGRGQEVGVRAGVDLHARTGNGRTPPAGRLAAAPRTAASASSTANSRLPTPGGPTNRYAWASRPRRTARANASDLGLMPAHALPGHAPPPAPRPPPSPSRAGPRPPRRSDPAAPSPPPGTPVAPPHGGPRRAPSMRSACRFRRAGRPFHRQIQYDVQVRLQSARREPAEPPQLRRVRPPRVALINDVGEDETVGNNRLSAFQGRPDEAAHQFGPARHEKKGFRGPKHLPLAAENHGPQLVADRCSSRIGDLHRRNSRGRAASRPGGGTGWTCRCRRCLPAQ